MATDTSNAPKIAIEFDDRPLAEKHAVSDIELTLPFVSSMAYAVESFVEPVLAAMLKSPSTSRVVVPASRVASVTGRPLTPSVVACGPAGSTRP